MEKNITWEDVAIIIAIYEDGIEAGKFNRYGDSSLIPKYSKSVLKQFYKLKNNEKHISQ